MSVRALLLWLLTALPAVAQGFANLGTTADGFAVPQRDTVLTFPKDHGPHPQFRIEWWYLTATLQGTDGRDYGVQWTLFRSALRPESGTGWQTPQLWMGHAGLTTPEAHYYAERLARGGIGQAGVTSHPFDAWIDDWAMTSIAPDGADALSSLSLAARGQNFAYDLNLTAEGPLIQHGERSFSVKSREGQASHYYSQPFYRVSGSLSLPSGDVSVTGQGWLDREWSSQPLSENQSGWDWISLSFEDGDRLMGFRVRDDAQGFTSGSWISADGSTEALTDGALIWTPLREVGVAGRQVPVDWRVQLPAKGLDVELRALNDQSWMGTSFPYWEGPVSITGSHAGRGYLEMTGYE